MSTSLLYHAFGIHGYHHVRTNFEGGATIFTVEPGVRPLRCPQCNSLDIAKLALVG